MDLPRQIREVYAKATCIHNKDAVEVALDNIAAEISDRLAEKNPIFLCVVIGGIVPMGNLLPRLDFPLEVDYVHATRYDGEITGGELKWRVMPKTALQGRVVVIVEDILDSGLTLSSIYDYCRQQGAKEVYSVVLVDKVDARKPGGVEKADFTGLTVEDRYVFGYGMDYKGYLRNAPGVFVVAPEHE